MAMRMVRVSDLKPHDLLDLTGDEFADPLQHSDIPCDCDDRICAAMSFPFEYAEVEEIERETPGCIRVDTQLGSFGFPPDHMVPVVAND